MNVSELCLDCGLCCDGTLFGTGRLEAADSALARETVLAGEAPGTFRQPCAALEGKLCRIYEQRPAACRAFDCTLVRELAAGHGSLEEARADLAEVFSRRAALAEVLGVEDSGAAVQEARRLVREGRVNEEVRDALSRLERMLVVLRTAL